MITTREKYDNLNIQFCDEYDGMPDLTGILDREKIWSFIETIEKEAEERGYEKCKQEKEMEEAGEGW